MKKAVSMLLSVVLSLSLFAGFGQTAFAAEEESTAGAGLQEYLEELMSREQNEDGSYALDEDVVYVIDDGEAYAQGTLVDAKSGEKIAWATLKLVDEQGNAVLNANGKAISGFTTTAGKFKLPVPSSDVFEKTYYLEVDAKNAQSGWDKLPEEGVPGLSSKEYDSRTLKVQYVNAKLFREEYAQWVEENMQPGAEELLAICRELTGKEGEDTFWVEYIGFPYKLQDLYEAASESEDLGMSYEEVLSYVETLQEDTSKLVNIDWDEFWDEAEAEAKGGPWYERTWNWMSRMGEGYGQYWLAKYMPWVDTPLNEKIKNDPDFAREFYKEMFVNSLVDLALLGIGGLPGKTAGVGSLEIAVNGTRVTEMQARMAEYAISKSLLNMQKTWSPSTVSMTINMMEKDAGIVAVLTKSDILKMLKLEDCPEIIREAAKGEGFAALKGQDTVGVRIPAKLLTEMEEAGLSVSRIRSQVLAELKNIQKTMVLRLENGAEVAIDEAGLDALVSSASMELVENAVGAEAAEALNAGGMLQKMICNEVREQIGWNAAFAKESEAGAAAGAAGTAITGTTKYLDFEIIQNALVKVLNQQVEEHVAALKTKYVGAVAGTARQKARQAAMDEIGEGVEALATLKDPDKVLKLYYAKVAEQLAAAQQALAQTKTDMIVQLELNDEKYGVAGELMARAAAENMAESAGMSEHALQAMKADNEKFRNEVTPRRVLDSMIEEYGEEGASKKFILTHEVGHLLAGLHSDTVSVMFIEIQETGDSYARVRFMSQGSLTPNIISTAGIPTPFDDSIGAAAM